ncbi:MAG: prolipoprotein diacylglyceryl transferase [Flavobacteriales bacterium]|nr:prolipoprotein diacylglyceryl transferase [Flavobacteriales bacterium]
MYPTLYDLVLDIFGVSIPAFKLIQSYGMMVGLGFLTGSVLITWELKRKEALGQLQSTFKKGKDGKKVEVHPHEHVGNIAILAGIGGIVGSKIFHNLENWDDFMRDPVGMMTSFGGFSFYGGLILAVALIVWYAKKNNIKLLPLLESGLPSVAIGYGFGRLGCHVAGDGDWGIPNDAPKPDWMSFLPDWMWAYDYPNNVLGVDLIDYYARKGYTSLTGFAWPTPIYEIIMSIIIFSILWAMRKRWKVQGMMVAFYLILTGIERLLIEKYRINNEYDILGGVTQAEIISVVMIVAGIAGIYLFPKYQDKLT